MNINVSAIVDIPEIVRLAAEYVKGNKDYRERIEKLANHIKELYFQTAIEGIQRALSENVEYTSDEPKDRADTARKLFGEESGLIVTHLAEMGLYCAVRTIIENKDVPTYEEATNKAITHAKELIKELKENTGLDIEKTYFLCTLIIEEVCENTFFIYHINETQEFLNDFQQSMREWEKKWDEFLSVNGEKDVKKFFHELDKIDKRIEKKRKKLLEGIYRYGEAEKIAAEIVRQLWPQNDDFSPLTIRQSERQIVKVRRTYFPAKFVMSTTKVNNKLFEGALMTEAVNLIATEKKGSKKELTVKVSIDFDQLEGVRYSRELEPFDRIVHDAVASLYEAGNEFITPLMIYRAMTGNPRADLTEKRFHEIAQSLNKLSAIRISIDANGEAKAYGMDKVTFKGNLLYTRSVYVEHNGQVNEWFKVLERPILLEYAEQKRQIDRVDIKMLNTPVNKNEETIILQDYLLRRIRAMKKSNVSRNILYETVYKQLGSDRLEGVEARKKKAKIREATKKILDFWKDNGEIRGYKENTGKNNAILSLTIILD